MNRTGWLGRLGVISLILLMLFFLITDRIEISHNQDSLDKASKQRDALISEIIKLQRNVSQERNAINILRSLIEQENALIVKLGGKPIPIPNSIFFPSQGDNESNPPNSSPQPVLTPRPGRSTVPSSPEPSPEPSGLLHNITCSIPIIINC